MRIYNGTPHSIDFIKGANLNVLIRKYQGGHKTCTIPSDGMLNAQISQIEEKRDGIVFIARKVNSVDPLPQGYDTYIVSSIYAEAYLKIHGNTDRLYIIADPVVADDGMTVIGCRGLMQPTCIPGSF